MIVLSAIVTAFILLGIFRVLRAVDHHDSTHGEWYD